MSTLKRPRSWLLILLLWTAAFHALIAYSALDDLRNGQSKPAPPLQFGARPRTISGMTEDAREAGVRYGDTLETVDGLPFENMRVFYQAVGKRKPSELLPVAVRSPKGTPFSFVIRLYALASSPATPLEWIGQILLTVALPVFCLSLGFWVAFRRPQDRLAWLLLALMIGFAGLPQDFPISDWPAWLPALAWWSVFSSKFGLWPVWLFLFAILFPAPMRADRKLPWLKWLLALPLMLQTAVLLVWIVGRQRSFDSVEFLRTTVQWLLLLRTDLALPALVLLFFFLLTGIRILTSDNPDSHRRLRILFLGSLIAFGPAFFQIVRSSIFGADLMRDATPEYYFGTVVPLLLFPLTLAYALTVRRAMDLRTTLRQGLQKAVARRGFAVLQIAVTFSVMSAVVLLSAAKDLRLSNRLAAIALGSLAIVFLRPAALGLAHWLDRFVFRDACENERILRDLALSLHTLMDEDTVINTVTSRLSTALHVPGVVFLTKAASGEFSANAALTFAENSGIVRHLKVSPNPVAVDFGDPKNWVHSIHPGEQDSLRRSRTEAILPVPVRDGLLGIVVLGPKRFEAPYTARDLRLLAEVATQAGFALENSRLSAQAADRRCYAGQTVERRSLNEFRLPEPQALADVHTAIIKEMLSVGRCPNRDQLAELLKISKSEVTLRLEQLAESHGLVLHPHEPECWIVHPFSTTPTSHWIENGQLGWWAPCLWCSLGVAALAGGPVRIHCKLAAEAESIVIPVQDGALTAAAPGLFVHFSVPPKNAWLNVHRHCALVQPFRTEIDARQWCERYGHPYGEAVPLENVAQLARLWYGSYANPSWRKWTVAEAREIFTAAGLASPFWQLPGAGTY